MKLTVLFMTVAILNVSAKGLSQNISFSGKNVTLVSVFNVIKKQTGYLFLYSDSVLANARPVTIDARDEPVQVFLKRLFSEQPLVYSIRGKNIIVELSSNLTPKLSAPPISGRIVDINGNPLAGATIRVKGKNVSTVSDEEGYFEIVAGPGTVLVASYIGFQEKEYRVTGADPFRIDLVQNDLRMDTTVVLGSTGYQVINKNHPGSYAVVNNKLLNRRVSPDILSRLEGVASGLLFDKGTENNIGVSIRGRSTIYANTQPLIIIDNLPFQGGINEINPNDVETITVLKDAAAASMWGALSGNGVIVITTKRGKNNQPVKLELNTNITIKQKPDLLYPKNFINSSEYIDLETDLFSKGWYDGDISAIISPLSPVVEILEKRRQGLISPEDSSAQINAFRNRDIRNDYDRYLYRPSVLQQYFLNLSGGSAKSNYYFSAGYDKDLQSIKNNSNDRLTLNSQLSFNPVKNLEITGGIVFNQQNSILNGMGSVSSAGKYLNIYPYAQLADENGKPLQVIKDFSRSFAEYPYADGFLDWGYYPLDEHKHTDNIARTRSNRLSASLRYTIIPGLSFQSSYLYQYNDLDGTTTYDENAYYTRNLVNLYSEIGGTAVSLRNVPVGSIIQNYRSVTSSNSGRAQLNFNKMFSNHAINAIAGVDISQTKTKANSSSIYGYDENTGTSVAVNFLQQYVVYPYFYNATIPGRPIIIPYLLDRFRSYFANALYTYNDRYTFTISGKLDQSNLFGVKTNQKTIPLWSVGTKWDLYKEHFYHINWLPLFSFRASYGYNGNYDKSISAFPTLEYIDDNKNGERFAILNSPGNPQLKWETIGILNVGLDFLFKNSRIGGSIEYYHKKGVDMIGNSSLPSSSGYINSRGNYSDMEGDGIDVQLNTVNTNGKIVWTSDILVSYATNKVTKNSGINLQLEGRPVNSVYVYRWGGLDAATGDPMGYLADTLTREYREIINQTALEPAKYLYKGSSIPVLFGGVRNTVSWKGLSFSANITFKAGYKFIKNTISYFSLLNNGMGHSDYSRRWMKKGDELSTNIPSMIFPVDGDRDNFFQRSEVNVESADHIRLQDINIAYSFLKQSHNFLPFKELRVYLYINNLGILWKANNAGIDPDYQSGFVNPRSYSFGVNMIL